MNEFYVFISKFCIEKSWSGLSKFGFLYLQVITVPNNKNLYWSKLKVFAENKMNMTQKFKLMIFFDKGRKHLFPLCFQKISLSKSFKVGIVW